jgi:very-short-patch-repair endonuclease
VIVSGFAFRLDLAWPTVMVAVEYDGVDHHSDEHRAKDDWRRRLLRQAGWTIIVVRKDDLRGRVDIISLVTRALSQREWVTSV